MNMINLRHCAASFALLALASASGCMDRTTIFDNPDPNLRLSASEMRGDAISRFPFKQEAPKAKEINARAQVAYPLNRVDVVNFSKSDWNDVEV